MASLYDDVDLELCTDGLTYEDDKMTVFVGFNIEHTPSQYVETLTNLGVLRKTLRTSYSSVSKRKHVVIKWRRFYNRHYLLNAALQSLDSAK